MNDKAHDSREAKNLFWKLIAEAKAFLLLEFPIFSFLKVFKPRLNFKVYFFSLAQTFINNEDKK